MPDLLWVPDNDQIALLEPFDALDLPDVLVVTTPEQAIQAVEALKAESVVGFDTESKPTFFRDQKNEGPHLVQFSTPTKAYLFPLHWPFAIEAVVQLLELPGLTKVGFGLAGDRTLIHQKLGARMESIVDLNNQFREIGFRKSVGVKAAVAVVFERRFAKSKRISTSDWSQQTLDSKQILYAANDAYAAIRVHLQFDAAALRKKWLASSRPASAAAPPRVSGQAAGHGPRRRDQE